MKDNNTGKIQINFFFPIQLVSLSTCKYLTELSEYKLWMKIYIHQNHSIDSRSLNAPEKQLVKCQMKKK